jgi:predicted HTH domain antitoxin
VIRQTFFRRPERKIVMDITLEVPDQYLVDHDPVALGKRIKLYAAVLMFQSEELSAGAAAALAEVDRFTFAAECQKHGIPLVNYPVDDLRAELAALRNAV